MTRTRWLLALPALLLLATAGPSTAAEIKDKANLFSAEAVKKAETELDRIETKYSVPVTIETIDSLEGQPIHDVITRHATDAKAKGIYILISKDDHNIFAEASKSYRTSLTREKLKAIDEAFDRQFVKKDFDAGLARGVSQIETTVSEAHPAPANRRAGQPPVVGKPSSGGMSMLLTIGLGLLALFIVIRILGALFGGSNRGYAGNQRMMGPGGGGPMGGPGYGPGYGGGGGGGGFMSSMFGGIGGALAGNWLYDQFSGRHHDSSLGASNYDPAAGAPPTDAGPEWGAGGAEGDWGGGDAGAGGGGDWGGGGGDAGGGGDWGGGGGGDWGGGGGGGDDGGSW
jgi:uncharacterized protein